MKNYLDLISVNLKNQYSYFMHEILINKGKYIATNSTFIEDFNSAFLDAYKASIKTLPNQKETKRGSLHYYFTMFASPSDSFGRNTDRYKDWLKNKTNLEDFN